MSQTIYIKIHFQETEYHMNILLYYSYFLKLLSAIIFLYTREDINQSFYTIRLQLFAKLTYTVWNQ